MILVLNDKDRTFNKGKHLHVFNKSDIKKPSAGYNIAVSAKTGDNIDKLKEAIYKSLVNDKTQTDTLLTSKRQCLAVKNSLKHIKDAHSLCLLYTSPSPRD